jgi:hypothetical protein
VVPLVAPLALFLVFVLMFLPWTGSYPGGYGVYAQTAFQMIAGWFSTDLVGDRVLKVSEEIPRYIRMNWLMVLFFLLLLLAWALTVAPIIMRQRLLTLPPAIQQIWPWRAVMEVATCAAVLLILLLQAAMGFGLENALATKVDEGLKSQRPADLTGEEREKWDIQKEAQLGQFNLRRTPWFRLAELFLLLAIAGTGLELWLEKRGPRQRPRVDFHW